jgi:hypothetical protein
MVREARMVRVWPTNRGAKTGRFRRNSAHLLAALLLLLSAVAGAEQYRWTGIERVVAISDPHGAYDALLKTLHNAGIIDASQQWAGGKTHLVITGDMLDRGADSRKVMDLVMALEAQAPESGGKVHLTLGNHEVMNLVGDLRYVSAGEYAAFAEEESEKVRLRWFKKFSANNESLGESELHTAFARDRPAGFYAHREAFGSDGHYGKWLLSRPVMVVINDTAYVHGGLSPLVANYNLDELNKEMKSQVVDYVKQVEVLNNTGFLDPAVSSFDHAEVAKVLAADRSLPESMLTAADTVITLSAASVHGGDSPLWYRGTVGCSTVLEEETLQAALDSLGATRVVIGHTPTMTREVLQKHDGRVIEIDTGMLNAAYRGSGFALIIEGDNISVINEHNNASGSPVLHPRRVGIREGSISAQALQRILLNGDIVSRREDESGREIVSLVGDGTSISAIFTPNPRNREFSPPLAAYRLDRLLRLDMVPVTVSREIDGKRGALQFYPANTHNESARAASGRGSDAWCSLPKQWNAMYVFDVLIYNQGRGQEDMLYSPDNWQLLLSGNAKTFDNNRNRPGYLQEAPLMIDAGWSAALASLTDEKLAEHMGGALDKRRLGALSRRRDLLLKEATNNNN